MAHFAGIFKGDDANAYASVILDGEEYTSKVEINVGIRSPKGCLLFQLY